MLPNSLTVPTGTYDKITQANNRSVFSKEDPSLVTKNVVNISHNTRKSGHVETVVYKDDTLKTTTVGVLPVYDTIRTQVKFTYNPKAVRTDTKAAILAGLQDAFDIAVDNIDSLLNGES